MCARASRKMDRKLIRYQDRRLPDPFSARYTFGNQACSLLSPSAERSLAGTRVKIAPRWMSSISKVGFRTACSKCYPLPHPFAIATCSLNYSRYFVCLFFFLPPPFDSRSAAVPDSSFLRLTLPVLLNARSKAR